MGTLQAGTIFHRTSAGTMLACARSAGTSYLGQALSLRGHKSSCASAAGTMLSCASTITSRAQCYLVQALRAQCYLVQAPSLRGHNVILCTRCGGHKLRSVCVLSHDHMIMFRPHRPFVHAQLKLTGAPDARSKCCVVEDRLWCLREHQPPYHATHTGLVLDQPSKLALSSSRPGL